MKELLSKTLVRMEQVCSKGRPAIMSSFGKDSMVIIALAGMLRLNLPVIYHRQPWFPEKNRFADNMISKYHLEVHDWPPVMVGTKTHADCIQPVALYQYGEGAGIKIPLGILPPIEGERYLCGIFDIIGRPKGSFTVPWDVLVWGQKACDKDIFEGGCRLKTDFVEAKPEIEGPALFYPIKDWTDADVWAFITENNIPYQLTRYNSGSKKEFKSKTYNNDWVRACMKCIDRREDDVVDCPKFKRKVPNRASEIPDLEQTFDYIEYSERST